MNQVLEQQPATPEIKEVDKVRSLVKKVFLNEIRTDNREEELNDIGTNIKLILQKNTSLTADLPLFLKALEYYKAGLNLNPYYEHIYWINMKGSVGVVSPKGYISLLANTGLTATLNAVYDGDDLDVDLANLTIKHRPSLTQSSKSIMAVYCILKDKNGIVAIELLRGHEIEAIRSTSKTDTTRADSPWFKFPEEMAKKACLKRAIKKISFDNPDFYKVLDIDNKDEFDFKKARIEVNNGIANPNAIDSLFEADSLKNEE